MGSDCGSGEPIQVWSQNHPSKTNEVRQRIDKVWYYKVPNFEKENWNNRTELWLIDNWSLEREEEQEKSKQ